MSSKALRHHWRWRASRTPPRWAAVFIAQTASPMFSELKKASFDFKFWEQKAASETHDGSDDENGPQPDDWCLPPTRKRLQAESARTEPKDSHRSKKPHWHARFERAEGAEIQQGSTKYGSGS